MPTAYREQEVFLVLVDSPGVRDWISVLENTNTLAWGNTARQDGIRHTFNLSILCQTVTDIHIHKHLSTYKYTYTV